MSLSQSYLVSVNGPLIMFINQYVSNCSQIAWKGKLNMFLFSELGTLLKIIFYQMYFKICLSFASSEIIYQIPYFPYYEHTSDISTPSFWKIYDGLNRNAQNILVFIQNNKI